MATQEIGSIVELIGWIMLPACNKLVDNKTSSGGAPCG
jgi:hypothetical protein